MHPDRKSMSSSCFRERKAIINGERKAEEQEKQKEVHRETRLEMKVETETNNTGWLDLFFISSLLEIRTEEEMHSSSKNENPKVNIKTTLNHAADSCINRIETLTLRHE